jgi:two-component system NtrC family sensor kinase
MLIIFSALGYQIIRLHRENLEEATYSAGDLITETIKRSTRYGMLHNRSDATHQIVSSIGSQPGIEKISIFNKAGEIRFSTDEREVLTRVDKSAEACHACHERTGETTQTGGSIPHQLSRAERTRIFTDASGQRVLSVINPIENEPSCSNSSCHAHSPETKVLGMINVRMSLEPVDLAIGESRRRMLIELVLATTLLSLIFAGLIWAMVHKPVHRLIVGTKHVATGDLDYKIQISSRDEVGKLAASFNRMTGELKRATDEINDWTKTLEQRVAAKTAQLQQAHDHVVQVERLASIGKLAAIVAHEINNPLAGILVYAKLLLKRLNRERSGKQDDEARKFLETIASESARCGEIVKGLLQFSRQSKPNAEPNDINEIIRESLRLVHHKLKLANVQVEILLDKNLGRVVCDAQQLKQALVALLINACEAVHQDNGVIAMESQGLPALDLTEIRIRDNGMGMDQKTKEHIFEPFFTTKEQGKGVGLGLAVVYGIITSHAGELEVESEPGRGTTFIIRLPNKGFASENSRVESLQEEKTGVAVAAASFGSFGPESVSELF